MKFTHRPKWKRIILAVICLVGLLAVAGQSYAAYTSQAYQRGVARNRDSETVRFTSNYMQNCASSAQNSDYVGRTVLFSEADKNDPEKTLSIDLYVYNYANDNTTLVSQRDITYTLEVSFIDRKGADNQYSVSYEENGQPTSLTADSNGKYTSVNRTLIGRNPYSHKYTITFPAKDLDQLKIIAVATPVSASMSVTNNQKLAATIAPCISSATNPFSSNGEFIHASGDMPADYDGFNYEISISSGKANATLTWDTSMVEIDNYFLQKIGKTTTDLKDADTGAAVTKTTTRVSLEFIMDQSSGTGDYLIPFYIKDKSVKTLSWSSTDSEVNSMDKIVTFKAVEQTT